MGLWHDKKRKRFLIAKSILGLEKGPQKYIRRSHVALMLLGLEIPKGYQVHHKDRNSENDNPMNLEILSPSEHMSHHSKGRVPSDEVRRRTSFTLMGHPVSIEARQKIGAAHRGKPWSPARRAAHERKYSEVGGC